MFGKTSHTRFVYFKGEESPEVSSESLMGLKEKKEAGEELDVEGMVDKVNKGLAIYASQIQDLPGDFQDVLHDHLVDYFLTSADRYDTDLEAGLDKVEFESYQKEMMAKLQDIILRYAPSKEAQQMKEKQEEASQQASEAVEQVESIELQDLNFNEVNLGSPEGIQGELVKFNERSGTMRDEATRVLKATDGFQKSFQQFEEGKKSWSVLLRGGAMFGLEWAKDPESEKLKDRLEKLKASLKKKQETLQGKRDALKEYGDKMNSAGDVLKRETLAERKSKFQEAEDREQKRGAAERVNESEYEKIESQQVELYRQKLALEQYGADLALQSQEAHEMGESIRVKGGQLESFGSMLDSGVAQLDAALAGDLPEETRKTLEAKRDELLAHKDTVSMGLHTVEEAAGEKIVVERGIEEKIDATQDSIFSVDGYLEKSIGPTMEALTTSLSGLQAAKLSLGTERERIELHYGNLLGSIDAADEAVADNVLENNLANDQMLATVNSQINFINTLSIERPTLWDATGALLFDKLGSGITYLTKDLLSESVLDPLSQWMKNNTENIPVFREMTYLSTTLTFDLLSGVIEGAGEMVGGISKMVAHPLDALEGLATLIGRNPSTNEWSFETAGTSWKELGKALIAYEEFAGEEGNIGRGIGKMGLNLLLTATGIGAAAKGAQGAAITYQISRAAGMGVIRAGLRATSIGARLFVTEFGSGVAKMPGELLTAPARALAYISRSAEMFSMTKLMRLEKAIGSMTEELSKLSTSLDDMSVGGRRISEISELTGKTAEELGKLSGDDLARIGVKDTATIEEFLRYREVVGKVDKLKAAQAAAKAQHELILIHPELEGALGLTGEKLESFINEFNKKYPEGQGDLAGQMVSEMPEGVLLFDSKGKLVYYGDNIAEAVKGKSFSQVREYLEYKLKSQYGDEGIEEVIEAYNKEGGLPVAETAYRPVFRDGNMMVGFDEGGKLSIFKIRHEVQTEAMVTNRLTKRQLAEIQQLFKEHVQQYRYNNAGMTLEFSKFVREARVVNPNLTMEEALAYFQLKGTDVVQKYGGGNCFALSDDFVRTLGERGIEAHIMGNRGYTAALQLGKENWIEGASYVDRAHGSVAIKFKSVETGEVLYMHLDMGVGPLDDAIRYFDHIEDLEGEGYVNPGMGISNLNESVMLNQLRTRNKIVIMSDVEQGQYMTIDFMKGKIHTTGDITQGVMREVSLDAQKITGTPGAEKAMRASLDYKAILANPSERVTIYVNGVPTQMTNIESLYLYLEVVGQHFGQPADFAENAMYLMNRTPEYYDELMLPGARDMYNRLNVPQKTSPFDYLPDEDIVYLNPEEATVFNQIP